MIKLLKQISFPLVLLIGLVMTAYWPFFLQGKIPMPGDTLIGAYFPWLDYKWGFPVGVPVKNALISDVFSQFFVWKYLAIGMWKQGIIPLWNPDSFSGYPFLATYHSAVFQPTILLLLLPHYWGWGGYIFAQTLLAATGMYFFAGRLKVNWQGRVAAGILYAFSGLMTTWTEFGTGVYAAAYLSWSLYFLSSFIQLKKYRYLLLLAISQMLLFLSGHAQLTIYSSILIAIYTLYYLRLSKLTFWVAGVMVIAVMLAGIQLLPAYDLTKSSIRSDEAYSKSFNYGLDPFYEVVRFFAPDFFGNPTTYNHWDKISYHEQSSFISGLSIILIAPFLFRRFRNKDSNFWSGALLVSLFLAFDHPVTRWIYAQPLPLLTYSSASRIFFIASFAVAVLLGMAITLFVEDKNFREKIKKSALYFTSGLAGIFLGLLVGHFWITKTHIEVANADYLKNLNVALKNMILPLGISGIFLIALYLRLSKKLVLIGLILLLYFDFYRFFTKYNPFIAQFLTFPDTPVTQFLKQQPGQFRVARADYEVMPPNTWIQYGLQSIEGYDPMALENYARVFNVINNGKYTDAVSRYVELSQYPSPLLNALNTKYLLAIKRDDKGSIPGDLLNYKIRATDYQKVFEDKDTVVLSNPHATERVYFVKDLIPVPNKQVLANTLQDKQFDPTAQAVLLSTEAKPGLLAMGEVKITSYKPDTVTMQTKSPGKGFVVLADAYEKGWQLLVDGKSQPLYEVNGALRGFWVDQGSHQIQMYYWPKAFDLGLKLSGFGILGLLGLLGYSLRKKMF